MDKNLLLIGVLIGVVVGIASAAKTPAPKKVTLEGSSPTGVTIRWSPPATSNTLNGWKIQYIPSGQKKRQQTVQGGDLREYVLEGLTPETQYKIRMLALTSAGAGKPSSWQFVTTLSEAAAVEPTTTPRPPPTTPPPPPTLPEPPRNVAAEASAHSARITWDPPADNGVETLGYIVSYGPLDNPSQDLFTVDLSPTHTVLEGLASNVQYRISLTAFNTNGRSLPGTIDFFTVAEETAPPPQLLGVRWVSTSPTSVQMTWSLPDTTDNDPIEGIAFGIGPEGTKPKLLETSYLEKRARSHLVDQLIPGSRYTVMLRTENKYGESDPVLLTIETSPAPVPTEAAPRKGPPPRVELLRAEELSSTSVQVTWTLPETSDANVIASIILGFGRLGTPLDQLRMTTLGASDTRYIVDDLAPASRYVAMVMTENKYGRSDPVTVNTETSAEPIIRQVIPDVTEAPAGGSPPPPVDNVRYESLSDSAVEITWTLPESSLGENEIESIAVGFGIYGIPAQFLPVNKLGPYATTFISESVIPGSRYTVIVSTVNTHGRSDPVKVTVETPEATDYVDKTPDVTYDNYEEEDEIFYLQVPTELSAEVVTPASVRISFIDPTLRDNQDISDDRYYTVRYKTDQDVDYLYNHIQDTTHVIDNLLPESNYNFAVKVVHGVSGHSLYSLPINVFTRDPGHVNLVQDVTVIQIQVMSPDNLRGTFNWLPPENQPQQITGYVVEYSAGYITPASDWTTIEVEGDIPSTTIDHLLPATTHYIKVAAKFGSEVGSFSNPPQYFTTPSFSSGQPMPDCPNSETKEDIIARVNWLTETEASTHAMVGVPLPYCDDYYDVHKCHGLICFCIPGKSPIPPTCSSNSGNTGIQGDQPFPGSRSSNAPCRVEYEEARRIMDQSRKNGEPILNSHLPYCMEDGYYSPKQCMGSLCYCSTPEGKHAGKEVPIWDVDTLICCK